MKLWIGILNNRDKLISVPKLEFFIVNETETNYPNAYMVKLYTLIFHQKRGSKWEDRENCYPGSWDEGLNSMLRFRPV